MTTTVLLSAANHAAALLESLDLAALPAIAALHVADNHRDDWTIGVQAQLDTSGLNELHRIDAIRAWAAAIGGGLRLDEKDSVSDGEAIRYLAATRRLADGSLFEVWMFLRRAVGDAKEGA